MKTLTVVVVIVTLWIGSTPVFADPINLVTNGSFEQASPDALGRFGQWLATLPDGCWDVYQAIPGWYTSAGHGIEIQTSGVVVPAYTGSRLVELDSDPDTTGALSSNSAMSQWLQLAAGNYLLSFWYRPRTGLENDNGIAALLGGESLLVADGTRPAVDAWQYYEHPFVISRAGNYELTFTAVGLDSQQGGLLDEVSVVQTPEPSSIIVLGTGLLLGAARTIRRRSRK